MALIPGSRSNLSALSLLRRIARATSRGDHEIAAELRALLDARDRERGYDAKRNARQGRPLRRGETIRARPTEERSPGNVAAGLWSWGNAEDPPPLSREHLKQRFSKIDPPGARCRENARQFRGWRPSSDRPCPRFEPGDETGPLDEDPCAACERRYDEHAKPRGVPCLDFELMLQVDAGPPMAADPAALSGDEPCDRCGHDLDEHSA